MIGQKKRLFDVLDSTNNYIKSHTKMLEDGELVIAKRQTAGRGRFGNHWVSDEGDLYFSFVIKRHIQRNALFGVLAQTALAVCECLLDDGIVCQIKYPNDIMVRGKKIAGILLESSGYETLDNIIVGVGLNINRKSFANLDIKATSMYKEKGKTYEVLDILARFIHAYNRLETSDRILEWYKKRVIFGKKTYVYEGIEYDVFEVTDEGEIILRSPDDAKTISYEEFRSIPDVDSE